MSDTKDFFKEFEKVVGYYLDELDNYSLEQFRQQPSEEEWSLGQMYIHLIDTTLWFIGKVERIEKGEAVTEGEKTEIGQKLFAAGEFPPIQIKIPPESINNNEGLNLLPSNPDRKEEVREQFLLLRSKIKEVEERIPLITENDKLNHLGFGYLNAREWFQLAYMHFRHHLHQKSRLDQFLGVEKG